MNAASTLASSEPGGAESGLRAALGQFATGVAVITARTRAGRNVGVTINSFASASLDPPLVLWSLSQRASSLPAFADARAVAIHVLAADQVALARRFASPCADRFAGLTRGIGLHGVPLLEGSVARFICTPRTRHEAGDHVLFLAQVERWERRDGAALVFHAARFCSLDQHGGQS